MVAVTIWGSLRKFTDGKETVEVTADNFKGVLDQLSIDHPGLKAQIKRGVSLAIDGKVYRESWFTPVKPTSEVVLMPFMVGG